MKDQTISTVFVRLLLEGAELKGVDYQRILLDNGISNIRLESESHRVPLESFATVARELMLLLNDEFMGLTERAQPLGSFAMMCRAAISAKTIKRSVKRTANYWNLFENGYQHQVFISAGRVRYEIRPISNQAVLNSYVPVALLSSIHRFHCWLAGQFIPLNSVSMGIPKPHYSEEYKPLFYGAPIHYQQPFWQLEFETRSGAFDIVQSAETLDNYIEGANLSLLSQPKHYRVISDQIRQWLEKNIRQGHSQTTLKHAAKHFRMSQQILHRRLQAEDTSFKRVKMQTRRDIAINLLFTDRHKVEEIANIVGFSEPSAFIRAFKSWTGETPLNYRQKNR